MRDTPRPRIAAALLTASIATAGVAVTGIAASAAPRRATTGPKVLVVGDSLTARARPVLRALRPKWTIDGVGGRKVELLDDRIRAHLAADGAPRVVVMALGSNETPGWTKADYVAATRLLPKRTGIVFLSLYRDPAVFGDDRAATMRRYSKWMREIARERPRTVIATWRTRVMNDPDLLLDGVHATEPEGERVWTNMVIRAVKAAS